MTKITEWELISLSGLSIAFYLKIYICLSAHTILLYLSKYCINIFIFANTTQTPWHLILSRTFELHKYRNTRTHTQRMNTSGVASVSALIYQTLLMFDCFLWFVYIETLKLV